MQWNDHSRFKDSHAILSPSQHSWLNYDENKLILVYENKKLIERGTKLHEIAKNLIDMRIELPKVDETLPLYVNDAIGYEMSTEVILYYSDMCFGTADAISFRGKHLRIHDLKTGNNPASMLQLKTYAALFCLEYKKKPSELIIELRIYQKNKVLIEVPTSSDIESIMHKIISSDKILQELNSKTFNT